MGNAEVGTFAASFLKAKTKRSVPLLMNEKKKTNLRHFLNERLFRN